jgi:Flp pilus assembly protein TadD
LLEGSLRKAGNRIRVTAQLINATDGLHLWADAYDANIEDILSVQEDIATKIASKFQLKPSTPGSGSSRPSTPNAEAYALYLKGLHALNKRTRGELERAVQLFNQAIDKDPTYAGAYAGLATTYAVLPDYSGRPQSEYLPLASAAAQKALGLDPASADAYAVLGLVKFCSHKFPESEEQFQHALSLNPNHATARHWYGVLLRSWNRMEQAGTELKQAEGLDPLSPIIKQNFLIWMNFNHQNEAGLELSEQYIKAFPDFALFRAARGVFLEELGRHAEGMAEILSARATVTNAPHLLGLVGYWYAHGGEVSNARKVLEELEGWKKQGYAVDEDIGAVHIGLSEFDLALDSFETAAAKGDALEDLVSDPMYDELRSLPRFQALLHQVGFTKWVSVP